MDDPPIHGRWIADSGNKQLTASVGDIPECRLNTILFIRMTDHDFGHMTVGIGLLKVILL
jgi:hypothetical protein